MRLSAFSINTIFVVMMILGISLIPRLSLQLEPSSRSNKLNISFSWTNANPELLETEVTTKLEGAFARIRGLNEIHSTTGNGYGAIELTIDPKENIDAVKLFRVYRKESAFQASVAGKYMTDGYKKQNATY